MERTLAQISLSLQEHKPSLARGVLGCEDRAHGWVGIRQVSVGTDSQGGVNRRLGYDIDRISYRQVDWLTDYLRKHFSATMI